MFEEKEKNKIQELAFKHASSQMERYKDSIFLPYITLPNAKGKGAMMEEFFEWYLNERGIKTELIKTNANYDFIINGNIKVELKVASIGLGEKVTFNQIHYGKQKDIDKFLLTIIKPDNDIDFFVIPKEEFAQGRIKVLKQHSSQKDECARISWNYDKVLEELSCYRVGEEKLVYTLTSK